MDAGRIFGNAISAAAGTERAAKTTAPKQNQAVSQQDTQCTLQISGEGYHKLEQAQKNHAASVGHPVSAEAASAARQDSLSHAVTRLNNFIVERAQLLGSSTDTTASNFDSPEVKETENAFWDSLENELSDLQTDEPSCDDMSEYPDTGNLEIMQKMQRLRHGLRNYSFGTNVPVNGADDSTYEKAKQSLALARQEDQVLRNGLSALYRYVVRDDKLSAKDRADAINRFVTEGRQTLAKIENSIGYRLARLRSIRSIRAHSLEESA